MTGKPMARLARLQPLKGSGAALAAAMLVAACGGDGAGGQEAAAIDTQDSAQASSSHGPVGVNTRLKAPAANAGPPIYRLAKISNGAYFYTGSEEEVNTIITTMPDFRYEGSMFGATTSTGGQPVYRFANLLNGGYFYTASPAERASVNANYAGVFRDESSSFSVDAGPSTDNFLVYRLANLVNGSYLYTPSKAEVDAAVATGRWRDEGVAYSARPTQLEECVPSSEGSRGLMGCRGYDRAPWAVGLFQGNAVDSQLRILNSACTARVNEIGDVTVNAAGATYTSRLDASTVLDMYFPPDASGGTGLIAHNPLDGSVIEIFKGAAFDNGQQGVLFTSYASPQAYIDDKPSGGCVSTASAGTKGLESAPAAALQVGGNISAEGGARRRAAVTSVLEAQ